MILFLSTMRKGIHPKSHKIIVQTTDGNEFTTTSTRGMEKDRLILQVDPLNHPLWTKKRQLGLSSKSRFADYRSKYGDLFAASNALSSSSSDDDESSAPDGAE